MNEKFLLNFSNILWFLDFFSPHVCSCWLDGGVCCWLQGKIQSSLKLNDDSSRKEEKVLIDMRRKEKENGKKRNWSENNRKLSRSTSPTDVMCDFDWSNVGTATAITTACLMVGIDCHWKVLSPSLFALLINGWGAEHSRAQWHGSADSIINRKMFEIRSNTNWLFHAENFHRLLDGGCWTRDSSLSVPWKERLTVWKFVCSQQSGDEGCIQARAKSCFW